MWNDRISQRVAVRFLFTVRKSECLYENIRDNAVLVHVFGGVVRYDIRLVLNGAGTIVITSKFARCISYSWADI